MLVYRKIDNQRNKGNVYVDSIHLIIHYLNINVHHLHSETRYCVVCLNTGHTLFKPVYTLFKPSLYVVQLIYIEVNCQLVLGPFYCINTDQMLTELDYL